ncbi:hypothetical protein ACE6H2_010795 [Prunus campanulata]
MFLPFSGDSDDQFRRMRWKFLGKCSFYRGDSAEFLVEVELEILWLWFRRVLWSFVPGTRQVSDTHRVRLGFQSGIWVGSCQFDYLKMANMVNLIGLVDPGLVSSQYGSLSDRTKQLSNRLKIAYENQFFLVSYNPGGHWVLVIVRLATKTAYYMNSLPKRSVDDDMKSIVNTSMKMFNIHINKNSSRK